MNSTQPPSEGAWHARIAQAVACSPDEVARVLRAHHIEAAPLKPRTRQLRIRDVSFQGTKRGTKNDGPFSFQWKDLKPGLWLVASDLNSRGKSTVLNVIKAALQGRFRGGIKQDVWRWIEELDVTVSIDGTSYRIQLTKPSVPESTEAAEGADVADDAEASAGAEETEETAAEQRDATGTLQRREGGNWISIYSGKLNDDFESAVSGLFMDELGIDSVSAYNKARHSITTHGWPVVSSALFVKGPEKALFGDNLMDGLPLRLIQTFIGLPWVSTLTRLNSALKMVSDRNRSSSEAGLQERERRAARLKTLTSDRSRVNKRLLATKDLRTLRNKRGELETRYRTAQAELQSASQEQRQAALDHAQALNNLKETRRTIQQVEDELHAGLIFRDLHPVCCPSCSAPIAAQAEDGPDKKEAKCGLCGHLHKAEVQDVDEISGYQEDLREAEAAEAKARKRNVKADEDLGRRQRTLQAVSQAAEALYAEIDQSQERAALEISLATIDARIEELNMAVSEGPPLGTIEDEKILTAAAVDVRERIANDQEALLREMSENLLEYCNNFGVQNLKSINLTTGGRIEVTQGNSSVTFSNMTEGERLRIRIAAALACVKLAKKRGYGRHPGLLVLDSPAAQEMSSVDFAKLVSSVVNTIADDQDIQIIVGAVMRPELQGIVPASNLRHASGDSYLF